MKRSNEKEQIGITAEKEVDFGEWFSQILTKAELIEYTDVSGCYVLRPRLYSMWEKLQEWFNKELKKMKVENAYFPLFIPESYLTKEKEHVEGFSPEVAWVTHTGKSKLSERLAIRPTSETIMYATYAKWIRSHRDLPLKLNQWCNIVRWEFKTPTPLLRSREFLWQEGHTVFAAKEEADKEVYEILDTYEKMCEEMLALPVIKGIKTKTEKFAGADYTTSIETFLPTGKGIQCATSHQLGQNFAKAFDISFLDENSEKKHPWQNSWGFSTRLLGAMIIMHSDDKGLVLPPKIAPTQCVIVPILLGKDDEKVKAYSEKIMKEVKQTSFIDDREGLTPGYKFNDWEMKGIPIRIEAGPKDLKENKVVLVRRDTGEKESVKFDAVKEKVKETLEFIQLNLLEKAKQFLEKNIVLVKTWGEIEKAIKENKIASAEWCEEEACEAKVKEELGAKTLNIPLEQPKKIEKCAVCGKTAKKIVNFAKSY